MRALGIGAAEVLDQADEVIPSLARFTPRHLHKELQP
jgi:hypothetical protein